MTFAGDGCRGHGPLLRWRAGFVGAAHGRDPHPQGNEPTDIVRTVDSAQAPGLDRRRFAAWYLLPPMTPPDYDLYRLDLALPPGMAARRVAVAETSGILAEIADARFTVGARVHSLRKYTKRLRALFRLVRSGFPDFKEANVTLRDIARLVSSHRDARVMAGLVEHLGRSRARDPVVDWFGYRADAADRLAAGKLLAITEQLQALLVQLDGWDFEALARDDVLAGFRKTFGVVLERSDLVSDESDSEEAHEWRKCCKDHWYHLRLLHDALPQKERVKIDDFDLLGDLLGSVHDRDVLLHHLDELPPFLGETSQARAIARAARRERKAMQSDAVSLSARLLDDESKRLASKIRRKWQALGNRGR